MRSGVCNIWRYILQEEVSDRRVSWTPAPIIWSDNGILDATSSSIPRRSEWLAEPVLPSGIALVISLHLQQCHWPPSPWKPIILFPLIYIHLHIITVNFNIDFRSSSGVCLIEPRAQDLDLDLIGVPNWTLQMTWTYFSNLDEWYELLIRIPVLVNVPIWYCSCGHHSSL